MSSGFFVKLPNRGAVLIGGEDRRNFLQGLVTNDVTLLDTARCVYSCLLTAQGRFLFDFFMTEQADVIQLECEGSDRASALLSALKKFKLRSKVTLDLVENIDVFAGTTPPPTGAYADPRHPQLGWRGPQSGTGEAAPFEHWDRHRLTLGIPDGSRDLEVERALMIESNMDRLNGISFTKGCFIGQELTARTHYRALAKKHLYTVQASPGAVLPPAGSTLQAGEKAIGEMRSSCGDLGMALLREDSLPLPPETGLHLYTA